MEVANEGKAIHGRGCPRSTGMSDAWDRWSSLGVELDGSSGGKP